MVRTLWTETDEFDTVVVQRGMQADADACLHRFSVEHEDTESVDAWMWLQGANAPLMPREVARAMRQRFAAGAGGFPLVGTSETAPVQSWVSPGPPSEAPYAHAVPAASA